MFLNLQAILIVPTPVVPLVYNNMGEWVGGWPIVEINLSLYRV